MCSTYLRKFHISKPGSFPSSSDKLRCYLLYYTHKQTFHTESLITFLSQEEIFGPLLAFVTVEDVDEAIKIINDGEKPLAFYVFTESKATFEYINRRTSAGGVVRNDVHMHYARELGEGWEGGGERGGGGEGGGE